VFNSLKIGIFIFQFLFFSGGSARKGTDIQNMDTSLFMLYTVMQPFLRSR